MVKPEELQKLVAQMRALGVLHYEANGLKLTLTAEAPTAEADGEDETGEPEPPAVFLTVHDHPDTFGGFVPTIKRNVE